MKKKEWKISSVLKEQRERAQLTQAELSQYLGCDESVIEGWETGMSEPTISECLVLSKLYGIPLDDMFGDISVTSVVSKEKMDSFSQRCRINTLAKRWYN